jgi:SET domain-containing protein
MSWLSPQIQTRQTGRYGWGVFAREPIAQGKRLAVLGGHILPLAQLFELAPIAQDTAFQISDDLVCTYATAEELCVWENGLSGDHFNHSCAPNAGWRGHLELVALRDIASDEEITFDYATCLTADFGDMDCVCGATNCRGRVTGKDWKLPELQERYRGYFQPYIEAKIRRLDSG